MAFDTKGLTQALEGKTLRVWFSGDEISLIRISSLEVHEDCNLCPGYGGIIFDVVETNQPERYEKNRANGVFWSELSGIERWELVSEG